MPEAHLPAGRGATAGMGELWVGASGSTSMSSV